MNTFRIIRKADNALFVYAFQPLANLCQRFGSPHQLSLFALSGSITALFARAIYDYQTESLTLVNGIIYGASIALVLTLYRASAWLRAMSSSGPNPLRASPMQQLTRLSQVLFVVDLAATIEGTGSLITLFGFLMLASYSYLDACDTPPPPTPRRDIATIAPALPS